MLTHFRFRVHIPWRFLRIGGHIRVWKDIQFDLFVSTAMLVTRDVFSALRGSCCDGIVASQYLVSFFGHVKELKEDRVFYAKVGFDKIFVGISIHLTDWRHTLQYIF